MNNAQLNNIIRFSFNFHQTMGNKIHDFDPGYILEKWSKYFGEAEPNTISDITHSYLRNYLSKWIDKWGEGSYTVMSKYLSIIHSINIKGFRKYDARNIYEDIHGNWIPSELLSLFERSTKGDISDIEYRSLHTSIEREIEDWFEDDNVKKDMIQIQRDMKIDALLERK